MRTQKKPASRMTPKQFGDMIDNMQRIRDLHDSMTPIYQAHADAGNKAYERIVSTNRKCVSEADEAIKASKALYAAGGRR
jgi:hypothetical protein